MSSFSILFPFSRRIPPKHTAVITPRRKGSAGSRGSRIDDTGKGGDALGVSLDRLYGPRCTWVEVIEVAVEGGRDEKGASPETSDLLVFKG